MKQIIKYDIQRAIDLVTRQKVKFTFILDLTIDNFFIRIASLVNPSYS